jgi:hypothetical protein
LRPLLRLQAPCQEETVLHGKVNTNTFHPVRAIPKRRPHGFFTTPQVIRQYSRCARRRPRLRVRSAPLVKSRQANRDGSHQETTDERCLNLPPCPRSHNPSSRTAFPTIRQDSGASSLSRCRNSFVFVGVNE